MHVIKRLLIAVCLMLVVASAALAQEGDTTPSPTLTNAEAIATIEALKSEIEVLAQDVTHDAELIDIQSGALDTGFDTLGTVVNYLSLGGAALGIIGALFGAFGIARLFNAQQQLSNAKEQVIAAKAQVEEVQTELKTVTEKAQAQTQQITENRQNLQLSSTLQYVAQNQHRTGDLNGALALYERMLDIDPENLWALYMKGYILTKMMSLDEAEVVLAEALSLDDKFYYALAARGFVKRRRGDAYDTDMNRDADNQSVNFEDNKAKRDQLYSEAEVDLWSALNAVERLVDADGESWWGALGGLYKRQDRFDEALKCYRRAAQTTPTSSYPAINQALLELKQGDDHYSDSFKRVAKLAQREINADPDNYWPYGDLVIAELVLNRVDDAATCYEELLLLIPKKVTDVLPRVHDTLNDIADDLRARNRVEQADAIEKFMNERLAR